MSAGLEVYGNDEWPLRVAESLKTFLAHHENARLILPTGSTVEPLYHRLDDLDRATVFLLDEFGGLPKDDPGRCMSMLRRHLLDHLEDGVEVHWPDVDTPDPDAEATRYGAAIESGGGIDLVLVGLGANGHVGMNEPGSAPDSPTRRVELAPSTTDHAVKAYGATRGPTWGITVGMGPLLTATEIWLLVTGAGKARILADALSGQITPDVPASLLRRHPRLRLFADEAAASRL